VNQVTLELYEIWLISLSTEQLSAFLEICSVGMVQVYVVLELVIRPFTKVKRNYIYLYAQLNIPPENF
jgi:hypothetical protein